GSARLDQAAGGRRCEPRGFARRSEERAAQAARRSAEERAGRAPFRTARLHGEKARLRPIRQRNCPDWTVARRSHSGMDPRVKPEDDEGRNADAARQSRLVAAGNLMLVILGLDPRMTSMSRATATTARGNCLCPTSPSAP